MLQDRRNHWPEMTPLSMSFSAASQQVWWVWQNHPAVSIRLRKDASQPRIKTEKTNYGNEAHLAFIRCHTSLMNPTRGDINITWCGRRENTEKSLKIKHFLSLIQVDRKAHCCVQLLHSAGNMSAPAVHKSKRKCQGFLKEYSAAL